MSRIPQPGADLSDLPRAIGGTRLHPAIADAYHWLLSTSWLVVLGILAAAFLVANAVFAGLYLAGGDCIAGARPGSLADAYFFSVQTMSTVGYGVLSPSTDYASWVASIEAGMGLVGFAMATGLMLAKFSRPTARVLFSTVAVIHPRDGVPHLCFRMANARRNLVAQARLKVVLLLDEVTSEGHRMRRLFDLRLVRDESPMFALTWTAMHPIRDGSPLLGLSPEAFVASGATIICSLTGIDDTFNATIQARYRYDAADVKWGAQFDDVLRDVHGERVIDLTRLSAWHDVPASPSVPVAPASGT